MLQFNTGKLENITNFYNGYYLLWVSTFRLKMRALFIVYCGFVNVFSM